MRLNWFYFLFYLTTLTNELTRDILQRVWRQQSIVNRPNLPMFFPAGSMDYVYRFFFFLILIKFFPAQCALILHIYTIHVFQTLPRL